MQCDGIHSISVSSGHLVLEDPFKPALITADRNAVGLCVGTAIRVIEMFWVVVRFSRALTDCSLRPIEDGMVDEYAHKKDLVAWMQQFFGRDYGVLSADGRLRKGSSLPAALFDDAARFAGVAVQGNMPKRAQAVVERAGLNWVAQDFSTGSTVTWTGLKALQRALSSLALGQVPASSSAPVGQSYNSRSGGVKSAPRSVLLDWSALDASTRLHQSTERALAREVQRRGRIPLSPVLGPVRFDLAWWNAEELVVVEVKSVNASNHRQQVRLAVGQVLEYVAALEKYGIEKVRPVVLISGIVDPVDRLLANRSRVDVIGSADICPFLSSLGM